MSTSCIFIGGRAIGVACLETLLTRGIRPELVVTNADDTGVNNWYPSLAQCAQKKDLLTIAGKKIKEPEVLSAIQKCKPEIIFCIGGTQLIPAQVLTLPKLGCLNIHPALLPKYRGRYSTAHAIFNGERYSGATLHWMDEGIDSGPIIMQERIKIDEDDTAKSLYEKFTETGKQLFIKFLDLWKSGRPIRSKPQDESKATYYPKGLPNNGVLDWSWSGKKIRNFIRAMTFEPFPPAEFSIGKKRMVVIDEKYFKGFE